MDFDFNVDHVRALSKGACQQAVSTWLAGTLRIIGIR
jgi:hypothetical protein